MQYGFADYRAIWEHARNAELRRKRQNPNVLYPSDRLYVPDKQEKQEARVTTQTHRFQAPSQTVLLRIVVKGVDDQPIARARCALKVEGAFYRLVTDGNGQIEQQIPKRAENGALTIEDDRSPFGVEVPIKVGHLDPVDEVSGQRARLNNLGYNAGERAAPAELQFRSAVEEFQCDYDLTVDGVCGPQTQAKLLEVHGC